MRRCQAAYFYCMSSKNFMSKKNYNPGFVRPALSVFVL